jgi:allene oxide cyclase-like protein
MSSRSAIHRRPVQTCALLIAVGALLAYGVLGTSASGQGTAPATLTFKELDKGSTFIHIRNTKTRSTRANSMGDLLAFTNPVADRSGRRIGKLAITCTTTTGARNFLRSTATCAGVVTLRDGTITVQANIRPNKTTTTGAVTGGTGVYANARGVVVSKQTSGSPDTITTITFGQ